MPKPRNEPVRIMCYAAQCSVTDNSPTDKGARNFVRVVVIAHRRTLLWSYKANLKRLRRLLSVCSDYARLILLVELREQVRHHGLRAWESIHRGVEARCC